MKKAEAGVFKNCASLKIESLPANLTSIGDEAFYGCTLPTTIRISKQITTVGKNAFANCKGVKNVTVETGVTLGDTPFDGCELECITVNKNDLNKFSLKSLKELTVNGEGYIDQYLYNSQAEHLYLSEGITGIAENALGNADNGAITIPSSLIEIGEYAFDDNNITDVYYLGDIVGWCNIDFGNEHANPLFGPGGTLYINNEAVVNLFIPNTVKTVKDYAFASCDSIKTITFEEEDLSIDLGKMAFYGCGVSEIVFPKGVDEIGYQCFAYSSITKIVANEGLNTIGEHAFRDCRSLTEAEITNVYKIELSGFKGCSSLKTVTFGKISSLGHYAFSDCIGLEEVYFPIALKYIGRGAFYGCYSNKLQFIFEANHLWKWESERGTSGTKYAFKITNLSDIEIEWYKINN